MSRSKGPSRSKMRAHAARLRRQGLRPVPPPLRLDLDPLELLREERQPER